MLDKPYPKVPKNIAGSIEITERALRAKEVLVGVGSSAISTEDGVGGSLSMTHFLHKYKRLKRGGEETVKNIGYITTASSQYKASLSLSLSYRLSA